MRKKKGHKVRGGLAVFFPYVHKEAETDLSWPIQYIKTDNAAVLNEEIVY